MNSEKASENTELTNLDPGKAQDGRRHDAIRELPVEGVGHSSKQMHRVGNSFSLYSSPALVTGMNSETDRKEELTRGLFSVEMPKWYTVSAALFRGVCLGFVLSVAFMQFLFPVPPGDIFVPVIAIIAAAILAALASLPKAWIEQRSRIRGMRDGSMKGFLEHQDNERRS